MGLILDQAILRRSNVMLCEALPNSTSALWTKRRVSSAVTLASLLRRSAHKHVKGPATSRSCSWILKSDFSAPKWGSFPFFLSWSFTCSSSFGADSTLQLGLGKSFIIADFSSSERALLKCLSRKLDTEAGASQVPFGSTLGSNSISSRASASSRSSIASSFPSVISLPSEVSTPLLEAVKPDGPGRSSKDRDLGARELPAHWPVYGGYPGRGAGG